METQEQISRLKRMLTWDQELMQVIPAGVQICNSYHALIDLAFVIKNEYYELNKKKKT